MIFMKGEGGENIGYRSAARYLASPYFSQLKILKICSVSVGWIMNKNTRSVDFVFFQYVDLTNNVTSLLFSAASIKSILSRIDVI